MNLRKVLTHIGVDLALITVGVLISQPVDSSHPQFVLAEEMAGTENVSYPYTNTFIISAYYSPLPCQVKYVTGSYDGDIRLNGHGVRGADGTPVYPGMVAAPRTYSFGTKMDIPGVGIVAVHDRGGAIVSSAVNGSHDRLDIWMGYGDKGLSRALHWGKRTVDVVVYGVNDSIVEQIALPEYSEEEMVAQNCEPLTEKPTFNTQPSVVQTTTTTEDTKTLASDLKRGDSGAEVRKLQQELKQINYYRGDITGNYGELTEHAVFKFQQSQGLVPDKSSQYAGIFGPKTRTALNKYVNARNYVAVNIKNTKEKEEQVNNEKNHQDKNTYLAKYLEFGDSDPDVKKLQDFLKNKGYYTASFTTDYYGDLTKQAVLKFQLEQKIVKDPSETGAGRVGPATLDKINSLS